MKVSSAAKWYHGEGKSTNFTCAVQIGYYHSKILLLLLFFPRCSSLYASERKYANGLIVFKEEKIYFRRQFLQAVQPLLSLQNHSVYGMD